MWQPVSTTIEIKWIFWPILPDMRWNTWLLQKRAKLLCAEICWEQDVHRWYNNQIIDKEFKTNRLLMDRTVLMTYMISINPPNGSGTDWGLNPRIRCALSLTAHINISQDQLMALAAPRMDKRCTLVLAFGLLKHQVNNTRAFKFTLPTGQMVMISFPLVCLFGCSICSLIGHYGHND